MTHKRVYAFSEGDGHNRKLLGGKGANLCEMTQIGINVPPGFATQTCGANRFLSRPEKSSTKWRCAPPTLR